VRTEEYIALPPCYSATVWPRFDLVREGIFQSMVKIDPTWYGQLGVALTNLSPAEYPIWKGKRFATLIIYELNTETDINLLRKGQTIKLDQRGGPQEINIEETVANKVNQKIRKSNLRGKCIIENGHLAIQAVLDRKELEFLRDLDESEEWHKAVEDAVRTKSCDALGLPALDLLLERPAAGDETRSPKRLTRDVVAKEASECTSEALSRMAVEKGRPFELIANIPILTEKYARGQVEVELNKEISRMILRIMAITVSLLGFISLVVAIIALVAHYLKWEFPKEIDVFGTLVVAIIVIAIVLIPILVYVFSLRRIPRGIAQARKQIVEVNDKLTKQLKDVDEKMQDKTTKLWEEIESIKSRLKVAENKR